MVPASMLPIYLTIGDIRLIIIVKGREQVKPSTWTVQRAIIVFQLIQLIVR